MVASALTAALAGASQLALHCQADVLYNALTLATRPGHVQTRGKAGLSVGAVASMPIAAALEVSSLDGASAISGSSCSPPRTRHFTGTRPGLAPSFCLSSQKTRRRRRPPTPGAGGGDDDGGAGDGFGGDDGDGGGWYGDSGSGGEEEPYNTTESLHLWQALCLCSLLQMMHYVITSCEDGQPRTSALAALTHSFYNSRPQRLRAMPA
ncbi:hypothetical protein WJX72_006251 [[Myrmecia] bisecta]|uniref:Uncharacterized protein n=1 Tax=[Myrmecia] bisecta TaxID=41462 RepID=A0AAW1QFI6_9CHLO